MGERHRHRRHALRGGVHDDHGVCAPRLAGHAVSHAAPQVDDFLAVPVDAARSPELAAMSEVPEERVSNAREFAACETVDREPLRRYHSSPCAPVRRRTPFEIDFRQR
jgi:hypothetical protein